MARDYAKKDRPAGKGAAAPRQKAAARKAPKPKRSAPAHRQHGSLSLKWVLSLAAVGGFIGFIVYLNTLPAGPEAPKQTAPAQQESPATTKAKQDATRQKEQNFRFYEMLPESEVVPPKVQEDRKSTRLNSSHVRISYAVFCLKKKKKKKRTRTSIYTEDIT